MRANISDELLDAINESIYLDLEIHIPYVQRINGGFKEGYQQFWKSAIKYKLKQRMSKYFGGE